MGGVQMKSQNHPTLNEEIKQFKRELKEIPEPNFGRIQELKEKIKKKTLITREAVEEAAERIADRFFGKS